MTAPDPRRRVRRLRLVTLIGLGALIAGATGAVAATVARRGDATATTPVPGPSIYIPYGSAQGGSAPGVGSVSGSGATGFGAPAVAPMPAGNLGAFDSAASTSIAYPYPMPGWCSGTAPAVVAGQGISATGMSRIATGAVAPVYVLWAGVSSNDSSDAGHAVADVQSRLAAVVDALVKAGVARAAIHPSTVSVWAGGGKGVAVPLPASALPANVSHVSASAGVSAELPDAATIDRAVRAAAGAGADNVNASTQAPPLTPPDADALNAAIAQATDEAHQLAAASAKAANLKLGTVHSISTQPPAACGYGPDGPQLVVAVTVSYDPA